MHVSQKVFSQNEAASISWLTGLIVNSNVHRYQCSFEGFAKQGYSKTEAIALMRQAVSLADEAIASYSSPEKGKKKEEEHAVTQAARQTEQAHIVLALSCYGAILSPGQEYSGKYPPPFGHPAHSPSSSSSTSAPSSGSAQNISSSSETKDWLTRAEHELEEWHYDRLLVFASDPSTWSKISYVAFETLPVLHEAKAVRRAMSRLKRYLEHQKKQQEQNTIHWPKWWVSFVFPDGKLPASTSLEGGDVSPSNIVKTVLEPLKMMDETSKEELEVEVPTGAGINCTKMRHLPSLVKEMTSAVRNIPRQADQERFLVLYPDGGLVYDPVTKTWHQDGGHPVSSESAAKSGDPAREWASQLVEIANSAIEEKQGKEKVWDGVILGGCCKASPAYIVELSKQSR